MTFETFLLIFTWGFIPLGSLTVTGWYFITRGSKETLPDGSIKKTGKIFMGWYFFWTQTKELNKKVQYKGKQLVFLYEDYLSFYPDNPYFISPPKEIDTAMDFDVVEGRKKFIIDAKNIKRDLDVLPVVSNYGVKFFKEYDDYVFPWWIRDPLAVCATCFASVYGSLFYWVVIYLQHGLFRWSYHPVAAAIAFWGIFCLSLAVLNTALAKKFN